MILNQYKNVVGEMSTLYKATATGYVSLKGHSWDLLAHSIIPAQQFP